jgi:alpha/beta superfamily hydrolase
MPSILLPIDRNDLEAIIAAANRYAEDLASGLEDGTYDEGRGELAELEAALAKLQAFEPESFRT